MAKLLSRVLRVSQKTVKLSVWRSKHSSFAMESQQDCFTGKEDKHNGIIVESTSEPCSADFVNRLRASLATWTKRNKKSVWFRVERSSANWIPHLVDEGFFFHHAKEHYVTLYKNLTTENNIPPYAHTNLGVGAFVINEKTNEVLVIKEKYAKASAIAAARWKLPGGYVEPGENIPEAAERELFEETGIRAKFRSLIGFRHVHNYAFGCSDIYMVARLIPETLEIRKCETEISECMWMKLEEYVKHPEVHKLNRLIAEKVMEYMKNHVEIGLIHAQQPNSSQPAWIYVITNDNDEIKVV